MTSRLTIGRSTTLCMSLSARPGTFGSRFHNHLYEALGLDWIYKAFTTTDLPAAIGGIRALGIRGCAISMPFKEACIPLLDALAPSAAAIGSVNTIVNHAGRLEGHNTDYAAIGTLLRQHAVDPATPFALRGSGGMAKAVACALRDAGFGDGVIIARNRETGSALARACNLRWAAEQEPVAARMLVNATPLGMTGSASDATALAFSADAIDAAEVVLDVVAVPPVTPLVERARAAGKKVITGDEIIVLQAVDQFALYTGLTPSADQVAAAAAFALDPTSTR
jgi:shikimate dehydrogenase